MTSYVEKSIGSLPTYIGKSPLVIQPNGSGPDRVFYENDQLVDFSYTIPEGKNAMSAGPVEIGNSAVITISNNSVWAIV